MKKFLALIVAIGMTCAFITGCSEDESSTAAKTNSSSVSSSADSSKAADSSEAETTTTTTAKQEETTTTTTASEADQTTTKQGETTTSNAGGGAAVKFEDSYTYKFQQSTKDQQFALNMKMTYSGVEMPIEFKVNKADFDMKITAASYSQEYICKDNVTYVLNSALKQYIKSQGSSNGIASIGTSVVPDGAYTIQSQTEENGMIVEKVKINATTSTSASEATYYFDKATGVPKKIDVTASGTKQTVTITSFSVGPQTITVPDLTGWTEKQSGAQNVQIGV